MDRYTIRRIDIADGKVSKARSLVTTMTKLRLRMQTAKGPVQLEIDGKLGPKLSMNEGFKRIRNKLKAGEPPLRIRVHPSSGPHFAVRKVHVEDELEPANIYATKSIQLIYAWTLDKFDFVYNAGLYVNKPYLHGTRPPDAFDAGVHYSSDTQAHERVMQVFYAWRAEAIRYHDTKGKQGLPINGGIGMTSIFGPYADTGNVQVRRYTGTPHVTHAHVSGSPLPAGHSGEV